MKLILVAILSMFSLSAFATSPVQSTIDQCIQANKSNPNRFTGCYSAVMNQVNTQAKDKVQQTYEEGLDKAEQQSKSEFRASPSTTPSMSAPQLPSKSAVQPKQPEQKKAGPRIKYY